MLIYNIVAPVAIFVFAFIMYNCVGHRLITSFYIWLLLFLLFIGSLFARRIIRYIIFAVIILYGRNIQFFLDFTYSLYKGYKIPGKTDNHVTRILVTDLFHRYFRIIHNFHKIPKKPTIFLSNYVKDRVENLACVMLPVDICPMIAKWLSFLQNFITPVIIRGESKQYDIIKEKIKEMHDKGYYVFVYIEKWCSGITDERLGSIRNGIFNIAKDLDVTVTPIAFDRVLYSKYAILKKQNYQICVGDTFKIDDVQYCKYKTRRFLGDRIKYFSKTKFNECY